MNEVIVSKAELLHVAGLADDVKEKVDALMFADTTGDVESAMPGATANTAVDTAGSFIDELSETLSGALGEFADAVRLSEQNYDDSDQSSSIGFNEVTEQLGDY